MNTRLIAALLVAVSASVAAPAFANETTTVTRAQVRAELAQLQTAGYPLNRATDATYPNDLQAALTQIHAADAVAANEQASGYGGNGDATTQSGRRHAVSVADRSVYFGH